MRALDKRLNAYLALEDGSVYTGLGIGAPGETLGEIVFNTCVSGYPEILSDPSYSGQIVLMTHPEIGNYGVNPEDYESQCLQAAGFVVRKLSPVPSSWRSMQPLNELLAEQGVVGIEGVDTRAITRKIRTQGAMKAGIIAQDAPVDLDAFVKKVQAQPLLSDLDLVGRVSTPTAYTLAGTSDHPLLNHLVVVDYGVKRQILECVRPFVRQLTVLPASARFEDLKGADAVLLSNGPGDPTVLKAPVALARQLISAGMPTLGVCLGHQILAMAMDLPVTKMRFGHHGGNHPVKDLMTGQISITSQNHNYAVRAVDSAVADITHVNLNDQTVEGIRHRDKPVFSVQFHPEASPGPHDARPWFEQLLARR
jgi:carbamoyl-phosphate synthase small subunit